MKSDVFKKILSSNFEFSGNIYMDSRLVKKGDIFIAINKGNEYIEKCNEIGAFVIHDSKKELSNSIRVENSITFMQKFAKEYRKYLKMPVIGITGSNGKTSVKDILGNILEGSYKTIGNYNNHIGLPYTILSCPMDAKYLILEMGMSELGEIDLLSSISEPDYGIIVNIGDSHIKYLKTRENVFKAKTEMLKYLKNLVIVPKEDKYLSELPNAIKVEIQNISVNNEGTSFVFENIKYHTNLYGKHNALNIALCIKLAFLMGVKFDKKVLDNIKLSNMRFDISNYKGNILINDAYNAAPKSVKSSLETLMQIFLDKDKYIVLGDMLELGENELKYHQELKETLEKIKYKKLYLYGLLMSKIDIKNAIHTTNKEMIKNELAVVKNSLIFLKASRGMKLEEILEGDK